MKIEIIKKYEIITLRLVVILCLTTFFPQLKIYYLHYLFIIYIYPGFPLLSLKPISQFGLIWEAISWAMIHSKVPEYNWTHFTLCIFLSVDSGHIPLRSSRREEESACIDYLTFLNWFINTSHVGLCAPMDCSWPGSSVYGISQGRILELIAISYSRGSSPPRNWTFVSCISCIGR